MKGLNEELHKSFRVLIARAYTVSYFKFRNQNF